MREITHDCDLRLRDFVSLAAAHILQNYIMLCFPPSPTNVRKTQKKIFSRSQVKRRRDSIFALQSTRDVRHDLTKAIKLSSYGCYTLRGATLLASSKSTESIGITLTTAVNKLLTNAALGIVIPA